VVAGLEDVQLKSSVCSSIPELNMLATSEMRIAYALAKIRRSLVLLNITLCNLVRHIYPSISRTEHSQHITEQISLEFHHILTALEMANPTSNPPVFKGYEAFSNFIASDPELELYRNFRK
jgi:hypothetical protein